MKKQKIFSGVVYGRTITARSLAQLKRVASIIANGKTCSVDEMQVTATENGENIITVCMYRINRKMPNNTIIRGEWA